MNIRFLLLIPTLLIGKGYYPTTAELNYPNKVYATPGDYCSKINSAPPKTTIVLKPGSYQSSCTISNKSYISIIGEDANNVVFSSSNYQFYAKNSHHVNIVGIKIINGGIFKASSYTETSHHIYLGKISATNVGTTEVMFTGPNSHDITLDRSAITHQVKGEYIWYALGYHQTVSNNYLEGRDYAINIRGYHPLNRTTQWDWQARDPIRNNVSKYQQLPANEWTHQIVNNEFGSNHGDTKNHDNSRGAHIGIYQAWNNSGDPDDEQYFPPQNVLIENNVFHDAKYTTKKGSIYVSGEYGFIQGADGLSVEHNGHSVIRGTTVRNNYSDQPIFREISNPNMKLINQSGNRSGLSSQELKKLGEQIRKMTVKKSPQIGFGGIIVNTSDSFTNYNNIITPNTNGYLPVSIHIDKLTVAGEEVKGEFPNRILDTLKDQREISDWNIRLNRRMAEYYTMKVVNQSIQIPKRFQMNKHNSILQELSKQKQLSKEILIQDSIFKLQR